MTNAGGVSPQDRINRRVYHARGVHRSYQADGLDLAETMALLTYQPAFAGRDVLDLGIGAGRTSRVLAPLARRYVGTDYSPVMIEHVRRRNPELTVELADMRDLSRFPAESFDFVLASCNVIDAVSHEDRLRTMAEVRRVLRPAGLFAFSSHNRNFHDARSGPRLRRVRNPGTQAAEIVRYVRSVLNHARTGRLREERAEYALLDDPGHDYALLHYYIDLDTQIRQLERAGFRARDVFDKRGARAADGTVAHSPSLLYVAMRTD